MITRTSDNTTFYCMAPGMGWDDKTHCEKIGEEMGVHPVEQCILCHDYQCGGERPHYQVPMLKIKCEIDVDHIYLFEVADRHVTSYSRSGGHGHAWHWSKWMIRHWWNVNNRRGNWVGRNRTI